MPKLIDISGQRFGRLTVVRRHDLWHGSARWECVCDCGKTSYVIGGSLRSGHSQSCGCLNREISSNHHRKHGQSHISSRKSTGAYRSWAAMLQRCENENSKHYASYGGRGIRVCDAWHDFRSFYKDMGDRPNGTSIDRINTNGNYEPCNCRWADRRTQQNNRRSNKPVSFNGKSQSVRYWADELGFTVSCLTARLHRGWSVNRALTTKPQPRKRYEPGTDADESPWFTGAWCLEFITPKSKATNAG